MEIMSGENMPTIEKKFKIDLIVWKLFQMIEVVVFEFRLK